MKKWIAALLAIALIAPMIADARPGPGHGGYGSRGHVYVGGSYYGGGYYGGYYGGGWGWRGNWAFPLLIGGALMYDMTTPRTVYVQPDPAYASPVVAAQAQSWYWCASANAYYPYVTSCPTGWQAVPATPPPPVPAR